MAREKRKRKKRSTIGAMTQTRVLWERKPQTQVVPNKRRKNDRKIVKEMLKRGDYDKI